MTASEMLSTLEVVLGGHCPVPRSFSPSRLLGIDVSGDVIEKLLRHWSALPESSRPRLRGLSLSREVPASRELLLEIGPRAPLLLVKVEPAWRGRSLTSLWPYCRWWEAELSSFEQAEFPETPEEVGVTWRRS